MLEKFEKYLKKQRENLDVENPDDQLIWEGIRKNLEGGGQRSDKKIRLIRLRNIAAFALIMLSLGYLMNDIVRHRKINPGISLNNLDSELGNREDEYKAMVSFKRNEIASFDALDNTIISELLEEIQELDTIYEEALQDLSEMGFDERIVHTIFDTYEQKIFLLELIILENNKTKLNETKYNQSNEEVYL